MKCEEARLLMNKSIDSEIDNKEISLLGEHLEHCERCTVEFEELRYLTEIMGEIEMKELPDNFENELHLKLLNEAEKENSESKKPFDNQFKMINIMNRLKKNSNLIVAAAAILIVVVLSNNPLGMNMKSATTESAMGNYEEMPYVGAAEFAADSSEVFTTAAPMPSARSKELEEAGVVLRDQQANIENTSQAYRTERMVIKTGYISLEIVNYDVVVQEVKDLVLSWDGYIESENTSKKGYYVDGDLKYGSMTIRIPNEQFENMMNHLKGYGNVIYNNSHGEDITKQYRDTAQDVENLKITESRFRDLLLSAVEIEDILKIENELTRIRGQINSYERQLKDWEVLVDLSSINIELNEVKSLKPVLEPVDNSLFGKAKQELIVTINKIRMFMENLVIWTIGNSPIMALLGAAIFFIWRHFRKIKKAKL